MLYRFDSLDYKRKRKQKGGITMPTIKITLDVTIGTGKMRARNKSDAFIIQLLDGRAMTMRELIDELTFDGKTPRNLAERIIKGAVTAGVLSAISL